MSGDNTPAMKKNRSYERLLVAILENRPCNIIEFYVFEYASCGESLKEFEENKTKTIQLAYEDAPNYFLHYQGGRAILVKRDSPLGMILAKGKYVPG